MTAAVLPIGHGAREYVQRICRCDEFCRPAWRAYNHRARRRRIRATQRNGGVALTTRHNRNTYANWGCQCAACVAAQLTYANSRKAHG